MAESPLDDTSEVLNLTLYSEGTKLDQSIGVASITIGNEINRIPQARIELHDGNMPEQSFPLSDGNDFDPGKKIRIEAGYGSKQEVVFEGIVVKHSIRINSSNDARLVVECRDEAVRLTVGRRSAAFEKIKDGDLIKRLITNAKLEADVDTTSFEHEKLVQYYCSDWDFLLTRAEANGLLVITDGGKVSVSQPAVSGEADLQVTYGQDLIELQAGIDARTQFKKVDSFGWDPEKQALAKGNAAPASLNQQGDLDAKTLSEVLRLDSYQLQTPAELAADELTGWAEAQQVKSGLARIRGRMKFQGSARARPGTLIELKGVGKHFNGKVFVASVTQQIGDGNWISEVAFGLAPDWFAEQRELMAPPAGGLVPGIDGLQIGKVEQVNADPQKACRIKIKLPLLNPAGDTPEPVWARLASIYASEEIGAFFLPEVDDEVLVGFLNNDPNQPIVLGSLFSASRKMPYETGDEYKDNKTKAIVTREQLRVEFDEEKKVISIATPGGGGDTRDLGSASLNKIALDDEKKSILLQDQNGNKVELSPDGITLDSPKDISIKAGGKIDINATGAISVSSNADVTVKGMNVDCEAQAGFTAKGNATAEVSASGNTTVKGAMVMIN